MRKIGAVTIGQSPRPDITADLGLLLGSQVEIVEAGALDDLTKTEIAALAPQPGENALVTRLADGQAVTIGEESVSPRLQAALDRLNARDIPLSILLCTGSFPGLKSLGMLLRPDALLLQVAQAVASERSLGILYPDISQMVWMQPRWGAIGRQVHFHAASPFGPSQALQDAARQLQTEGCEILIMDCMGYSLAMQETVRQATGLPILLARGVLARIAKELLG